MKQLPLFKVPPPSPLAGFQERVRKAIERIERKALRQARKARR